MRIVDIIEKKRDGKELTCDEIDDVVLGYVRGNVTDYQMAAWLMAVCCRGMGRREIADLTQSMVVSGRKLDLSRVPWPVADKHSTGGVGDKVSLVVAPLVRACGAAAALMSGRGLGFTGGTLDKLEAIPGMNVMLSADEFVRQAETIGIVISGQSPDLVPADGKMYALRDVTGTVPSIALAAASIMSKKLAVGAQGLVLDVKVGRGAFMRTLDDAMAMAKTLVELGNDAGMAVSALLTRMDQPLGRAVGNALEVKEAIDVLKGDGPADLVEVSVTLAGEMLYLVGLASSIDDGKIQASAALERGEGLTQFVAMVEAQGGCPRVVDRSELMGHAPVVLPVMSQSSGYLQTLDAREVAAVACSLGAGRQRKEDNIDPRVGVILHTKEGDQVTYGQLLAEVHAADDSTGRAAADALLRAFEIGDESVTPPELILGRVDSAQDGR
jgi:pyrimidine-nucleoside phosphorylase